MIAPILTFTAPATNQLLISWESVSGAVSYTIQFRTSPTAAWTTLATTNALSYLHSVTVNTLYYYRLSANGEETLVWSDEVSARTFYPTSCTASKSATAITLAWGLCAASSYSVQRSTDNVIWETVADEVTSNSFADSTFEMNRYYYYRVLPNEPTGVIRAISGTVGVWQALSLTAEAASSSAVILTCPNPDGYTGSRTIQYATSLTGSWSSVTSLNSSVETYTHTGLTPGATYYYRAYCSDGNYSALYLSFGPVTLPQNIGNAVAIRSGDVVFLSWDVVADATEYMILKSTDQVNWTQTTETTTVFCDESPVTGMTNYYKITAIINGDEYSSAVVSLVVIGEPETFEATLQSSGRVYLSWSACTGATTFQLQRRLSGSSEWSDLASVSNRLNYTDSVTLNTRYDYRIQASGGNWKLLENVWYPDVSALAPSAFALTDGTIRLDWSVLPEVSEYQLSRSTLSSGPYDVIGSSAGNTFIDHTLDPNTTYYYRVGFAALNIWSGYCYTRSLIPEIGDPELFFNALSTSEMEVTWEAAADALTYTLQFRSNETADWTTLGTTSETVFIHSGQTVNSDGFYRRSVNTAETVTWSRQHRSRIIQTTSLAAVVTNAAITLNWAAVSGVTEFIVERSEDQETWETLAANAAGTSFADTTFVYNTNYFYRVRPNLSTGANRDISVGGYFKATTVNAALGPDYRIDITYDNPTAFIGTRTLYRTTEPTWTNPTRIATSTSTASPITLSDTETVSGASYYYWLACGSADSVRSNAVVIPQVIGQMTAFALADRVCLSWDAVENADHYTLARSVDLATWTEFTCETTSFIDTTYDEGIFYSYRSETTVGDVLYRSELASAIVLAAPETITATRGYTSGSGVSWSSTSGYYFTLSWSACSGATAYIVEYRVGDATDWTTLTNNNLTTTRQLIGITQNLLYYFRVKPVGGATWKELGPVWYPNMTELYPEIEVNEEGYLHISWTPFDNAPGYVIARSTTSSGSYLPVGQTNDSSFIDRSAIPNTRYYYKIGFPNDTIWSVYVTEVSGNYPSPPTELQLAPLQFLPDIAVGTTVGTLTTTGPSIVSGYVYTLVEGDGDDDNALFVLDENSLKTAVVPTEREYKIRIRSTDSNGLYIEAAFILTATRPILATPSFARRTVSYTTALLYWSAVTNATTYVLEYKSESAQEWTTHTLLSNYTYSSPYHIQNLLPGTTYQFRLHATATGCHDSNVAELTLTTIADNNPPTFNISSGGNIYVEPFSTPVLPVVTAIDAVDGNLPVTQVIYDADDQVIEQIDTTVNTFYNVVWSATDSSGNTNTVTKRVIITDAVPPVITLNEYGTTGQIHPVLPMGESYVEYGATAVDSFEGPVEVISSGTVDSAAGIYSILYTAQDSSGNQTTATRTVAVSSQESPVLTLSANVGDMLILNWTELSDIPVTLQRRTVGESEWTTLAVQTVLDQWTDETALDDTRYEYRLIAANGVVLSNTLLTWLSDTTAPEITVVPYGDTGGINASVLLGEPYIEYGATAIDRIDPEIVVETVGVIDTSTPGLQTVVYRATDVAGHTATASRHVFVYVAGTVVISDFTAVAISQSTIRLRWTPVENLSVNIERRRADSDQWTTLAENIALGTFDDSSVEPVTRYFYRITMTDGVPLSREDVAWLLRVAHYSVVVQPLETTVADTAIVSLRQWSVLTQFSKQWSTITEFSL